MSILLVDDEPGVTRALELNLKREGWTILTADSGAVALQLLNERTDIEVLASDFNMPPGMDGAQLVNQALAMRPGLYAIIFSGFEEREYATRSLQVGADDFIDKQHDFAAKVAEAIRRGIQQVTIERMGRKLLALGNKRVVLDCVFQMLRQLERFDGFFLATRRVEGATCRVELAIDLRTGEEIPMRSALSANSIYRFVIESGLAVCPPVFLARPESQPAFEDSRSIIVVPLLGEESALGIEDRAAGRFKLEDLRFMQRLAQWVSLAMTNIRLLRERRRREQEQGLLAHALFHEINNPLNSISMLAQSGERLEGADLGELIANVSRIRQVLDSSLQRLGREGESEVIAVEEVLEETISRFRDYYPRSQVEIDLEAFSMLPRIHGKREMLIHAFMDLLRNGAEATGGRLTILAQYVPLRRQIEIAIMDNGRGIPPDKLRKVFDYGFTTDGEGHFGQGLALTQDFIQRHGGNISVTSREGAGTVFKVVLPVRTRDK